MTADTGRSSRLLNALALRPADCTPIWCMRQAGRSLPEYRSLRERHTFLDICRNPELTAQVTMQPVQRLGVDAAILFADIVTPLIGIGLEIDLVESVGPVVARPIASATDVDALRTLEPATDIAALLAAIRLIRTELKSSAGVPLIGFAGAPFTLASYLIEGRASRDFKRTKKMMYSEPELWRRLMTKLADMIAAYLLAQIDAGVQAVQLFDSWAGALSPSDYVTFAQPYTSHIFEAIKRKGVPAINFSTGTAGYLETVAATGGSTVGVDWRVPLNDAWERIGFDRGIQGNLDPMVLLGAAETLDVEVRRVLAESAGRPGHVFNLGHGVHPDTPVDNLRRLVEVVHECSESILG